MAVFCYSTLASETDTHPKRVESNWAAFCAEVLSHPEPRGNWPLYEYLSRAESEDKDQRAQAKAQKSGPAWCPATFGTHANAKGSLRHDGNVLAMYAGVADIDNKIDEPLTIPEIQARLKGYTFALHTSYSHTPEKPRYRVIVPLARPLPPAEMPKLFAHFRGLFGSALDEACKNPSRLYFTPGCPPDAEEYFRYEVAQGECLDPDTLVAPGEASRGEESASEGSLEGLRVSDKIKRLIAEGMSEEYQDDRSRACAAVISAMLASGYDSADIVDVLMNSAHGISARPREIGYKRLLEDVQRLRKKADSDPKSNGRQETGHAKEPIPLIPEQEPPLPYPLDALGELLGNAAQAIAEHVQVPEAMAGQSVLAAAALSLQPFYEVDIPSLGKPTPLSLNALTIAESGDRKTSTDSLAIRPIHAYQHKLWEAYEKERRTYEEILEDYLATSKKDRLGRGKPIEPRAPFILVDEPTLEGIHRALKEGRPSLGLFNDEGGQFIGGHAMNKDNMLKTIAGLSKLWDGHFISWVRGGKDESYLLYGKRFSCHLMVQPIVANSLLADKLLMGQGLLARFLITQPASLAGTRLYKDGDPSTDERLGLYWKKMTAWLEKAMPENEHNELTPAKLPLTQEAKALWVKAYDTIEKQLAPQGNLKDIKPFAAKAAENTSRVAGVIQAFEDLESKVIEVKAMKGAIRLMLGHYLKETLRVTTRAEPSDEMAQAQRLLEWLRIKTGSLPFKESLIYQKGPPFARSASRAKQLLKILSEHYWIIYKGDLYKLRSVMPGGIPC
jgi:hypothetical protein